MFGHFGAILHVSGHFGAILHVSHNLLQRKNYLVSSETAQWKSQGFPKICPQGLQFKFQRVRLGSSALRNKKTRNLIV